MRRRMPLPAAAIPSRCIWANARWRSPARNCTSARTILTRTTLKTTTKIMPADLTGAGDTSGDATACLRDARRLIVKIGSALLVDETTGKIRRDWLDAMADDVALCRSRGQEVIIVSSGAIAVGREHL